jgi:hypothetical protein
MNKSESIKDLSAALSKAQAEMKNPHFDSVNPHFKSKFASLGAVLQAVIPVLNKHGIALSQWPISNQGAAGCVTRLSHTSGEWMEEPFLIPVDKQNAHGFASAVTYSKRIAAQSVAGVVGDTDDDGNTAVGDNVDGKAPKGNGHKSPTTETMTEHLDALPIEVRESLRRTAADIEALIDEKRDTEAWTMVEETLADAKKHDKANDTDRELYMRMGLWSLLGSKARSAIKRVSATKGG